MLTLKAPAKINWFLRVRGKRPDGYHEITSLMQCLSLHDSIGFESSDGPGEVSVHTEAPIAPGENLVLRAAARLKEATGTSKGARITLVKKIPIAAGLGGGSSDAASTLIGLNRLWGLGLSAAELSELALGLGSDVPFFLHCPLASVGGRGEIIRKASIGRPVTLLLANPAIRVSAGWAYSGLKEYGSPGGDISEAVIRLLEAGDFATLAEVAGNDLEAPVMSKHPEVAALRARLAESGAVFSAMSGSGPTVFGVYTGRREAEEAEASIGAPWSGVFETLV